MIKHLHLRHERGRTAGVSLGDNRHKTRDPTPSGRHPSSPSLSSSFSPKGTPTLMCWSLMSKVCGDAKEGTRAPRINFLTKPRRTYVGRFTCGPLTSTTLTTRTFYPFTLIRPTSSFSGDERRTSVGLTLNLRLFLRNTTSDTGAHPR